MFMGSTEVVYGELSPRNCKLIIVFFNRNFFALKSGHHVVAYNIVMPVTSRLTP